MSTIICPNKACGATLGAGEQRHCPKCGAFLPLPDARDPNDPLVGQPILDGKYRILSVIGEGGMGKVYLAEQKLGTATRKVAIKTLQPDLAQDPQIIARFYRETQTVIELEHPNTIKFYDFGELEDHGKKLFVAMEYLQGESLARVLARGPIDVARTDRIMSQICGSLQEAHDHGIIHRDLKPDNIYLTQKGARGDFVKVLDFGIAKRSEAADEKDAKLTRQGMVLGTPPYMAPEQFTGQELDPRSDIYALGCMAYQMLTGALPFNASTPWEWASQHLTGTPTPLEQQPGGAQIPLQHRNAVMRALRRNREERPASVTQFLQEFTGKSDGATDWTASSTSMPQGGQAPPAGFVTGQPFAPGTGPMGQASHGPPTAQSAPTPNPFVPVSAPGFGTPQPAQGYGPPQGPAGFQAVAPTSGYGPGSGPMPFGVPMQPQMQPAKGGRGGLIAGIVVALAVLAGGGGYAIWYFTGDDDDDTPPARANAMQPNATQPPTTGTNNPYAQAPPNNTPPMQVPFNVTTPATAAGTPQSGTRSACADYQACCDALSQLPGMSQMASSCAQIAMLSTLGAQGEQACAQAMTSMRTGLAQMPNCPPQCR